MFIKSVNDSKSGGIANTLVDTELEITMASNGNDREKINVDKCNMIEDHRLNWAVWWCSKKADLLGQMKRTVVCVRKKQSFHLEAQNTVWHWAHHFKEDIWTNWRTSREDKQEWSNLQKIWQMKLEKKFQRDRSGPFCHSHLQIPKKTAAKAK